jgi:hypothetical protein
MFRELVKITFLFSLPTKQSRTFRETGNASCGFSRRQSDKQAELCITSGTDIDEYIIACRALDARDRRRYSILLVLPPRHGQFIT